MHGGFPADAVLLHPGKRLRTMKRKHNSELFLLLYLGILSAFGPFVMDMYLPAFPVLTEFFGASSSMVQLSLTASTIGLAAGQLFFGTVSDKYGRRPELLTALGLFMLATAGCLLAGTILDFIAFRFIQGLAAAGGIVLSRSIATDRYAIDKLARMLALIGAVNGVATVLSPVGGGILSEYGDGWHGIFWFLLLFGGILLLGTFRFRESLPKPRRKATEWRDVGRNFREVLHNRAFLCQTLQYGFAMSVLFVNLASAPFIMQEHYGLTPSQFSLFFGLNAVAMAAASAAVVRFPTMEQAVRTGNAGMLLFSALLCVAFGMHAPFWAYEALIFGICGAIGIVFTASNTLAMDSERQNAGVASALLGASAYVFGGLASPMVGIGDLLTSTAVLFFAGSLCSNLCLPVLFHGSACRPSCR